MVLVCHNVFGLFVRHLSWSVEGGGTKVSEHPVHCFQRNVNKTLLPSDIVKLIGCFVCGEHGGNCIDQWDRLSIAVSPESSTPVVKTVKIASLHYGQ